MNLKDLAQIYTDLVRAEKEIPEEELRAKEEINALRTKYHEMLMEKMREEKVEFFDRYDATRKAFEILQNQKGHKVSA